MTQISFIEINKRFNMLRFLVGLVLLTSVKAQSCDPDPCVHGQCVPMDDTSHMCECEPNWTGNECSLPQPDVVCGNKTIEIFIDKRIVTEQGLPGSPEFVYFMNAEKCSATEREGVYYLKVNAPFRDCGLVITHNGGDYTFYQQIVWNQYVNAIERPLVLLNFTCTYQDKYTVSFGEITPFVTTVDFETSYGTFKVDMKLYKDKSFSEDAMHGARPLITVKESVCVATTMKEVMPDLVLTNRNCWASTKRDGSGTSHYLVSDKCKDDPTTEIISNGEGVSARFCFQVFKWKDSMDEIYLHCYVNVCNVTAYPDYCQCRDDRAKRSAPSIFDEESAKITIGPMYPIEEDQFKDAPLKDVMNIDEFTFNGNPKSDRRSKSESDSKTTVLIAVGVVLVIALIVLGVVVAVYINCRRKSRDTKAYLRNQGEPVVIPNPTMHDAYIRPNI